MTDYRSVDWKRNIRAIPPGVNAKLSSYPDGEFVVGCVKAIERCDIQIGKYEHLKLRFAGDQLIVIDQILPLAEMGKFSTRNREGWNMVRKDLPKYTKTFSYEVPNFGDWSRGSHTVYIDRKVFHRDYFDPTDLNIVVKQLDSIGTGLFVFKFYVGLKLDRSSPSFNEDLVFALNILQENIGMADVISIEETDKHLLGMKWSCKIGQSVKVYSNVKKEYQNDQTTEVFRPV